MFLTEEDAKKKWCPMYRAAVSTYNGEKLGGGVNSPDGNYSAECQASNCMLWRWQNINERTMGYCGLAPMESNVNVRF